MQELILQESKYTPYIRLNAQEGLMSMRGKSYPENTYDFYKPVMQWIEQYFENHAQKLTKVELEIIYFNSSSSKMFFDLFDLFEEESAKHAIQIQWIYDEENESALEAGEDFKEDFEKLDLNLCPKKD